MSFVVAQRSLVVGCRRFRVTRWLHLQAVVVQFVSLHAVKTYWGSGGTVPLILDLCTAMQ